MTFSDQFFSSQLTLSYCLPSCVAETHTAGVSFKVSESVVFIFFPHLSMLIAVPLPSSIHKPISSTLFPLVCSIFMDVQLDRKVLFAEHQLFFLSCCVLCSSPLLTFDTEQRETGLFRSYLSVLWKHFVDASTGKIPALRVFITGLLWW